MSSNKNGKDKGKTVCKEVCTTCKCLVVEKPIKQEKPKKKDECVATIVGVLSLPDNFCKKEEVAEKKEDCTEVFRDFGECLQKCILKTSCKNGDSKGALC